MSMTSSARSTTTMIEYGGEEIQRLDGARLYPTVTRELTFTSSSIPRVPRGTVVTVGEHTFTTDMESDDGSTGDLMAL